MNKFGTKRAGYRFEVVVGNAPSSLGWSLDTWNSMCANPDVWFALSWSFGLENDHHSPFPKNFCDLQRKCKTQHQPLCSNIPLVWWRDLKLASVHWFCGPTVVGSRQSPPCKNPEAIVDIKNNISSSHARPKMEKFISHKCLEWYFPTRRCQVYFVSSLSSFSPSSPHYPCLVTHYFRRSFGWPFFVQHVCFL